jgi:hypothetical protein
VHLYGYVLLGLCGTDEMDLPKNMGLVKLPSRLEIAVYLIKAEIKNRKFTKGLEQIGFDTTICMFDFSSLILQLVGIDARTDEMFEFYNNLLESYVQKMELEKDDDHLNELAFSFYHEIEAEKRKFGKN